MVKSSGYNTLNQSEHCNGYTALLARSRGISFDSWIFLNDDIILLLNGRPYKGRGIVDTSIEMDQDWLELIKYYSLL